MDLEFDVQMTTSALYDYNMHHTYTSLQGLLGTVAGMFMLIGYSMNTSYIALLIAGLLVVFYNPVSLFTRSKKQLALNPAFKKPLHYRVNEEGVTICALDEEMTVLWEQMYKAYSTNQSIILATGKANAWIFPKKDLGEDKNLLIEMISTHMGPEKIKIKQ